ncbi:MAG TPA: hypothetical protein VHZ96_14910 [Frankiaceae bacterium]|jgi:hypothetical protein|nr:hypothetical protein [Frankiaceae bacterium]
MLSDPRPALAEQSSFIGYLLGLAGLARAVRALAADGHSQAETPREAEADDFGYLLLGVASVGDAIDRLAESARAEPSDTPEEATPASTSTRWLR